MLQTETTHSLDLTPALMAVGRGLRVSAPAMASPLPGNDFTLEPGADRDDVCATVIRVRGRRVRSCPCRRQPARVARAAGASFSNCPVTTRAPGVPFSPRERTGGAGFHGAPFDQPIDPKGRVENHLPVRRAGASDPRLKPRHAAPLPPAGAPS